MIGQLPALVLGRLGPLFTRVFRADLQSETGRMIEQHADLLDDPSRQRIPTGVFDRYRALPGNQQRILRQRIDRVTGCWPGVESEKLAGKVDRIRLRSNPGNPQSQPSVSEELAAARLKVVGPPAKDSAGNLATIVAVVVDVVAGQK